MRISFLQSSSSSALFLLLPFIEIWIPLSFKNFRSSGTFTFVKASFAAMLRRLLFPSVSTWCWKLVPGLSRTNNSKLAYQHIFFFPQIILDWGYSQRRWALNYYYQGFNNRIQLTACILGIYNVRPWWLKHAWDTEVLPNLTLSRLPWFFSLLAFQQPMEQLGNELKRWCQMYTKCKVIACFFRVKASLWSWVSA